MRTGRHNIAGRMITKALSKCPVGAGLVYTDIGSDFKPAQHNLQLPTNASNRTSPAYFFPRNLPERKRLNSSRPDAVLIIHFNAKHTSNDVSPTHSHHALRSSSRRTTRTSRMRQPHELMQMNAMPEHQLNAAKQQHADLCTLINAKAVTVQPILLGAGGTIYTEHTLKQFKQLGLDHQCATKLAQQLHAHSVQYAHKLVTTRRAIENKNTPHSQVLEPARVPQHSRSMASNKFWAGSSSDEDEDDKKQESEDDESSSSGSSDSDSDSGSDASSSDDSSSDDERGPSKFLAGSSDSDSDDERRVVKSAKDKSLVDLGACCEDIRNKMKINDWLSIQSLFDELNRRLDKYQKYQGVAAPRMYIRMLVELDDFLNDTMANKDIKKKMSSTNAKALNAMRQRLKKHIPMFAELVEKYKENPESTDEEEEEEEEEGGKEEGKAMTKKLDKLMTMDPKEITFEMVHKKLMEIVSTRGRRGTDRQEQLEMLQYLVTVAKGPAQRFEVLGQLVSSLFDSNPSLNSHLKTSVWKKCVINLLEMMKILQENPHIKVDETLDMSEDRTPEPTDGTEYKVWGNLVAFVERLDDEMFKSLQVIDPHTHEYMTRLKDEPVLLALAQKVSDYLQRNGDMRNLAKVTLRLVEHFYFKTQAVYNAMRKLTMLQQQEAAAAAASSAEAEETAEEPDEVVEVKVPSDYVMGEDSHSVMRSLVTIIFKHGDERTKARAMMCSIYHKAIHADFYGARDLLLMSHLQESIQHMDISTQILYNRALAQLGLSAFRNGLISEAHSCLNELYGSNHIKELLAQGMQMNKYQEKTPDQELAEKRRQMPFHMHISLEMLESVCLICAMLLEVPSMAANPLNPKKRIISKSFHRILDTQNRQEELLEMIRSKLQAEALRTYLFSFSCQYNSLSLDQLCAMFDLPEKKVYSIVSKMMIDNELQGSWDQPTRTIVMQNMDASRMQQLAMQFTDKAMVMVDLNERALAYRTGGLRDNDDEVAGGRRRGQQWEGEDGQGMIGGGRGGGRGRGQLGMVRAGGMLGGRGGMGMGYDRGYGGRGMAGGRGPMGGRLSMDRSGVYRAYGGSSVGGMGGSFGGGSAYSSGRAYKPAVSQPNMATLGSFYRSDK
ncbi:eukaryotic translation initiation factor 3 subunit 8 N-terminus-domain-containing protein [Dunaliella salina]|uniref:Eukaryotic translation initiation factor 3 subunit C n=1 Tax=Dunaliella salina TaxID=3046 RepID=A0ABQ7H584_DUNSA|nr:eukaryotic translation initiation factor 3 subunit 8 N-terminus-domain-containing protein [Dunaliella salina]|eukprot:KAF5842012.1 eukaryotic translation initiation factor 3 subunit 8 N-terminus-domain-containing protein [Dunaliella salina]